MQEPQDDQQTQFVREYNWPTDKELCLATQVINCLMDHMDEVCPTDGHEYVTVTVLLASNPLTPAQVLDHMSRYLSRPRVLERVASNANSPRQTLQQLARHQSPLVRSAVAESANLDEDTERLLANDESADVRFALAENYFVSPAVLDYLQSDENPYVSVRAQETLKRMGATQAVVENMPARHPDRLRRVV